MASVLYKRYIPPKKPTTSLQPETSGGSSEALDLPAKKNSDAAGEEKTHKKRRREGIDTVKSGSTVTKRRRRSESGIEDNAPPRPQDGTASLQLLDRSQQINGARIEDTRDNDVTSRAEPKGEFAHIKNIKKRHKLEKEARKARRVAGNIDKAAGSPTKVSGQPKEDTTAQANDTSSQRATALVVGGVEDKVIGQTAGAAGKGLPNSDAMSVRPKKRRHKLEAVLHERESAEDGEDDEHLRKHTGVMSKFQKATKHAEEKQASEMKMREEQSRSSPAVPLRDLVPLPVPEPLPEEEFRTDPSLLPGWLAKPSVVSMKPSHATFDQLGLDPKLSRRLSALTFKAPLPVQEALVPILMPPGMPGSRYLPGSENVLPDVAVHAPTGSGKTLAYMLPIIEALKAQPVGSGKLRALVIVPTRELVLQGRAIAEALSKGSKIKVGGAEGRSKLSQERARLIREGRRFDPDGYEEQVAQAHQQHYGPQGEEGVTAEFVKAQLLRDNKEQQFLEATISGLVDHVPTYESAVDLLITTPGRLLEHLHGTLGFTLQFVDWLVLDEADKLLEQQYDGFLEKLNTLVPEGNLRSRGCRKIVLSATMSRDVSQLSALKLRRPTMLVVEGAERNAALATNTAEEIAPDVSGRFFMPSTLEEFCVPAGDGGEKPLLLLNLLQTRILQIHNILKDSRLSTLGTRSSTDTSDESSSENSTSNSGSSSEDSSDLDSSMDGESDSTSSASESVSSPLAAATAADVSYEEIVHRKPLQPAPPTVLIFTSSTESAVRLSHLVKALLPDLAEHITTLTKAGKVQTPDHKAGDPLITIATDRASRGLDTLANRTVTHVIQYDVPTSLLTYVHRAGRTARAGRAGESWTLYEDKQARWFVNEIMRTDKVVRKGKVEKVKLVVAEDEQLRDNYATAVAGMRDAVFGNASVRSR